MTKTTERRLNKTIIAGLFVFFTAVLITQQVAIAFDSDNLFELGPVQNANILGDGNTANGPDWADLFDANGNPTGAFVTVADSFSMDQLAVAGLTDDTIFASSNKNNDLISTWTWDTGNIPAKDDLTNVYTTAIINPTDDHLIIFAGVERIAPEGDSHIDIEFSQDQVSLDEATPCDDSGNDPTPCNFNGERIVGDVVVSMDFLNGGAIGEVTIRQWDGTEFVLVDTINGEGCDATDTACAFNNGGLINGGPWENFDRKGTVTELEQNAFTEFGMDVTALFDETPCISNFMGKTRSSQSFTAELKDFSPPTEFNVCSAFITIEPDGVNEVGDPHTFTVNAGKKIADIASPANDGTIVTVDITDADGAISTVSSDTCSTGTVGGTCDVTFTSDTSGTVTGHASTTVDIGTLSFFVETDATGSNSDDAVKRFVDARISIEPDGVNEIGEDHTFTVDVDIDDGTGSGFATAPDGTIVTVDITDADGAISTVSSDTCSTGTVGGTCDVTFTSDTSGTVTGHASVTFTFDGVELTRSTDGTGSNSDDAVKEFVAGSLAWIKHDNAGQLLGGATFEVCRTDNFNSETLTFDPITPECFTVVDDTDGIVGPDADQNANAGELLVDGLVLGKYTVEETVSPAGFDADMSIKTAELTLADPNASITIAFVNHRPIVKITEFGYTNAPTGTPTQGVTSGSNTYTVSVQNFGGTDALATVSLIVSIPDGLTSGSLQFVDSSGPVSATAPSAGSDCVAGCTITWSDVLLDTVSELSFNVTVEYDDVPDTTAINAELTSTYTTTSDSLERTSSGSPALIVFTAQED